MPPLVSLVSFLSNPLSLSLPTILLAFALLQIAFPDPPTLADCLRYAFVFGMAYLTGSLFLRVVVQPEIGEGDCGVGVGYGGGGAAEDLGVGEDARVGYGDGGWGGEEDGSQQQQQQQEQGDDEDLKIPGSFLHDSPQIRQPRPPLRDGPSHRHRHHQHRLRRSRSSSETLAETPLATEHHRDKKQKRHDGDPEDERARARSRGGEEKESLVIPATPLGGALHPSGLMGESPVGRG